MPWDVRFGAFFCFRVWNRRGAAKKRTKKNKKRKNEKEKAIEKDKDKKKINKRK